nr:UvrD-helicase domain-containing protein [Methylobacterium sp. L1A1]
MPYIAIRRDAIEDLIAERAVQSTDFQLGKELAESLKKGDFADILPRIAVHRGKHGQIVYGKKSGEQNFIVFDLGQSKIFSSANEQQVILFFQRTLRFSIKFWEKGVFTPAEKIVNAKKAALFPFPLSQKTGVRISFDLNPDVERLSKRGKSGRHLLVYSVKNDEGDGPNETASLAEFRKFLEDLESSESQKLEAQNKNLSETWNATFSSASLGAIHSQVDMHQAYETWLKLLTDDQRRFALATLDHPLRIEGPAGTGKTASLSVAAVHALKEAQAQDGELQAIFITHSEASCNGIRTVIEAMGGGGFLSGQAAIRRLRVETLQSFCAQLLRQDISETEFVDPDAYDAKQLQLMYVDEALRTTREELFTYANFMSEEFLSYMQSEDDELKVPLIQHEIAVVIKGRSSESLDIYKKVPSIPTGLPIRNEADKAFMWRIYERYREHLVSGGQFDTDDVVLSALSQLSTPIWRRRRARDGFDVIFVDETHLFNMNELSIFHHLTRNDQKFPIAFAVDRSQAIGDRGWADDIDVTSLMPTQEERQSSTTVKVNGVFRCSPDIVNLAFAITSSGASLFTNFQDPMSLAHSNMTYEEEKKSRHPTYVEYPSDEQMIAGAFDNAEKMRTSLNSGRGDVAVVAFSDEIYREMERLVGLENKPYELLKHRGDLDGVRRAKNSGRFVLSLADYVGGLEFDGVILVGVDDGRVPPSLSRSSQSKAFVNFAYHNRLYVAVTRARYQVEILGVQARGPSPILKSAINGGALSLRSSLQA